MLPHIGLGTYDIKIVMSGDGDSLAEAPLLRNVDLASQHGPLVLHVDAPSPGSIVVLRGHFHFTGGRPSQPIGITAISARGISVHSQWRPWGNVDAFRFAVPSGKYHVSFNSFEIEEGAIDVDTASVKDLAVDLHVRSQLVLRGSVSLPGAAGPEPAREFLVRVVRLKDQRGRQPRRRWQRVFDLQGKFTEQLPGPGVYAVEATADGFLTVRSEPIDANHLPEKGIQITLTKGASVAGTVVDEEGRPIDGAIVMSLAKSGAWGELPVTVGRYSGHDRCAHRGGPVPIGRPEAGQRRVSGCPPRLRPDDAAQRRGRRAGRGAAADRDEARRDRLRPRAGRARPADGGSFAAG